MKNNNERLYGQTISGSDDSNQKYFHNSNKIKNKSNTANNIIQSNKDLTPEQRKNMNRITSETIERLVTIKKIKQAANDPTKTKKFKQKLLHF